MGDVTAEVRDGDPTNFSSPLPLHPNPNKAQLISLRLFTCHPDPKKLTPNPIFHLSLIHI